MPFRLGVDVGGTFTDLVLTDDTGRTTVHKTPSTPANPAIGFVTGIRELADLLSIPLADFVRDLAVIVHGTTVTTNAVLTGNVARSGLLTTEGFRDILEMRQGLREEMFNNRLTPPSPLVPRPLRLPVQERVDAQGQVLTPLDPSSLEAALAQLKAAQVGAVTVCFMHSYANPAHERTVAEAVRQALPDAYITTSVDLLPQTRLYDRVSTCVLNSAVGPVLERYLKNLTTALQELGFAGVLLIMQSNGGVTTPRIAAEQSVSTLLSGPAGAPVAGVAVAAAQGFVDCLTVDMGGTSFDAALVQDSTPLVTREGWIARYRLAWPMLDIHTIGSGGGSIGWIDEGGLLRMGPQSAGASPGPACYGRGGTLPTCTDADLVLGYLNPDFFLGGRMALDLEASRKAIAEHVAGPLGMTVEQAAAGMHQVINVQMATGVREISVKRGIDPRDFPMVVAGGAGAIHAGFIAHELDMPIVLVPPDASVFCAGGMLRSDLRHDHVRTYRTRLSVLDPAHFLRQWEELGEEAVSVLGDEGVPKEQVRLRCFAAMRYLRQHHEINVDVDLEQVRAQGTAALAEAFHAAHNRLYGYSLQDTGRDIEVLLLQLAATGLTTKPTVVRQELGSVHTEDCLKGRRQVWVPERGRFESVPIYDGEKMAFGNQVSGPAIIERIHTTIVVPSDYDLVVDRMGTHCVYKREIAETYLRRVLS